MRKCFPRGRFQYQHHRKGKQRAEAELHSADQHGIHIARAAIHHNNLEGKEQRARERIGVAHVDLQFALDTQQIQTYDGQRYADPYDGAAPSAGKQAENRNDHNVERRDEAGIHGGGVFQPKLLKRGRRNHDGAQRQSQQRIPLRGNGRFYSSRCAPVQNRGDRKKNGAGNHGAQEHEGKRIDVFRRLTLRRKSHAPYKGAQDEKQGALCI